MKVVKGTRKTYEEDKPRLQLERQHEPQRKDKLEKRKWEKG